MFGLFPADSHEMIAAIATLKQTFGVNDGALGLPRYENDHYQRNHDEVTGNYWFITSLWLAQYYVEQGREEEAKPILTWVKQHALTTGVLAEQVDPLDDTLLSVAPLTWSHAEYISTLLDTITEAE